uniref:Cleavage/polyadenylation specificity factor A subunit N-terminal domain-containing protein n=1 Tax=Mycena chlorophos TaxID=658473 RepID=A0ABQ0M4S1_MYCCL|nr:predicted protein [Mycena chlorophos]
MHISTLEELIDKPYTLKPALDHPRGLFILPEPIRVGPTRLCVFDLPTGRLLRSIDVPNLHTDSEMLYREEDARALVTVVVGQNPNRMTEPYGTTLLLEVDVLAGTCCNRRSLPVDLVPREAERNIPPQVLEPCFFEHTTAFVASSTTRWLGTVELLSWLPEDNQKQPTHRRELRPDPAQHQAAHCKAMLPRRHLAIDAHTLVLATHLSGGPSTTETSLIHALSVPELETRWEADPIPGQVESLDYVPALEVIVVTSDHDVTDHAERTDDALRFRRLVVLLDARTGERRATDFVDSEVQGAYVLSCHVFGGRIAVVCDNGEVLVVSVAEFLEKGFGKEGGDEKVTMQAVFPGNVIAAAMGEREIVAVAGVRKHPVISENGSESDRPEWEEEEGRVMYADELHSVPSPAPPRALAQAGLTSRCLAGDMFGDCGWLDWEPRRRVLTFLHDEDLLALAVPRSANGDIQVAACQSRTYDSTLLKQIWRLGIVCGATGHRTPVYPGWSCGRVDMIA